MRRYQYYLGFFLVIALCGAAYFFWRVNSSPAANEERALAMVKALPAVQRYQREVPGAIVEVDNIVDGAYHVHVYEITNGHTATFSWYLVNLDDGSIEAQFDVGAGGG